MNFINFNVEWRNDVEADWHQCVVHLYQASFYLHRTYASWCEDEWRRDSPVLMTHHVFTFVLLSTGFTYRLVINIFFVLIFLMRKKLLMCRLVVILIYKPFYDNSIAEFCKLVLWYRQFEISNKFVISQKIYTYIYMFVSELLG